MADDTTKQILINVELKADQLKSDVLSLNKDLDQLLIQQVKLKGASQENTAEYVNLQSQIRNTRQEIRSANKDIDNSNKALNAESNSIKQNRALLSLMTSEYVKLGQELGKTAPATVQLGKDIDNLTTKLKTQEGQIGQTYRNVGNYSGALRGLQGILSAISPQMSSLTSGLTNAAKNFNILGNSSSQGAAALAETGEAAEGADGALAGLAASGGIVTVIIAAVAGAIYKLGQYLKDIAPIADQASNVWAGLGASFTSVFNTVRNGDFSNLIKNFVSAIQQAERLNQAMIDLNRNMVVSDVQSEKENQYIAEQMLKLRNLHTTAAEAEQIFNNVQQTANTQYARVHNLAVDGYSTMAKQIANGAHLAESQMEFIMRQGVAAAEFYKKEGYAISDDQIKQLANFQNQITQAEGIRTQTIERAQNREDQRKSRDEARAAREQAEAEKEKKMYADEQLAIKQAESEKIASISRTLDFQMEAFGKEISATDEHYRQLIFKQQEFIEKQQKIADDPKNSTRVRDAANTAIGESQKQLMQLKKRSIQHLKSCLLIIIGQLLKKQKKVR